LQIPFVSHESKVIRVLNTKIDQAELVRMNIIAQNRKIDAHEKIMLGGLIVKVGLRKTDKALILGVLVNLRKQIEDGTLDKQSEFYKTLVDIGQKEFKQPPRPDLIF